VATAVELVRLLLPDTSDTPVGNRNSSHDRQSINSAWVLTIQCCCLHVVGMGWLAGLHTSA